MAESNAEAFAFERKVRFVYERRKDLFTAIDEESGLPGDRYSNAEALATLSERTELHEADHGVPSEREQNEIRREIGNNPDEIEEIPVEVG